MFDGNLDGSIDTLSLFRIQLDAILQDNVSHDSPDLPRFFFPFVSPFTRSLDTSGSAHRRKLEPRRRVAAVQSPPLPLGNVEIARESAGGSLKCRGCGLELGSMPAKGSIS